MTRVRVQKSVDEKLAILREWDDAGRTKGAAEAIARRHGISARTLYNWRMSTEKRRGIEADVALLRGESRSARAELAALHEEHEATKRELAEVKDQALEAEREARRFRQLLEAVVEDPALAAALRDDATGTQRAERAESEG